MTLRTKKINAIKFPPARNPTATPRPSGLRGGAAEAGGREGGRHSSEGIRRIYFGALCALMARLLIIPRCLWTMSRLLRHSEAGCAGEWAFRVYICRIYRVSRAHWNAVGLIVRRLEIVLCVGRRSVYFPLFASDLSTTCVVDALSNN